MTNLKIMRKKRCCVSEHQSIFLSPLHKRLLLSIPPASRKGERRREKEALTLSPYPSPPKKRSIVKSIFLGGAWLCHRINHCVILTSDAPTLPTKKKKEKNRSILFIGSLSFPHHSLSLLTFKPSS